MSEWFKTSLGQHLTEIEKEKCAQLLPSGYYARSLQVGFPWMNYLEGIEVSSQFIIDTQYNADSVLNSKQSVKQPDGNVRDNDKDNHWHFAVSSTSALPFPEKTHDLIVMPHTLDYCRDPHEVLRQINQILVPEGCLIIVGFNLFSFYGGLKMFNNHSKKMPWNGRYYTVSRVQDWLALLGIDLIGALMMSYQPPIHSAKWRSKMAFIEKIGERWLPGMGGVYVIVGRKREMVISALPRKTQTWRNLIPGIAQPASQRAAKISLKLVPKN